MPQRGSEEGSSRSRRGWAQREHSGRSAASQGAARHGCQPRRCDGDEAAPQSGCRSHHPSVGHVGVSQGLLGKDLEAGMDPCPVGSGPGTLRTGNMGPPHRENPWWPLVLLQIPPSPLWGEVVGCPRGWLRAGTIPALVRGYLTCVTWPPAPPLGGRDGEIRG